MTVISPLAPNRADPAGPAGAARAAAEAGALQAGEGEGGALLLGEQCRSRAPGGEDGEALARHPAIRLWRGGPSNVLYARESVGWRLMADL